MSKFSRLLPKQIKQPNTETQLQFNNSTLGVSLQNFSRTFLLSFEMCLILKQFLYFCNFTIEIIGDENGHLLKFVDLRRKINQH